MQTATEPTQKRPLVYQGREVGYVQDGKITPTISESALIDLIHDLEPHEITHLPQCAPVLSLLAKCYHIKLKDYTGLPDCGITALEEGCHNLKEVKAKDTDLANLILRMRIGRSFERGMRTA